MRAVIVLFLLVSMSIACSLGTQSTVVTTIVPSPSPALALTSASLPNATNSPAASAGCNHPDNWVAYSVQGGDTLGSIAVRTGSSVASLVSANCLPNADRLTVGETLYVPAAPAAVGGGVPLETGDQGCLYETPIPGAASANIQTVDVQPSTQVNGNYQVTGSSVTLIATGVTNAAKVRFCLSSGNSMTLIGEAAVVNGQAQLAWQIPSGFTNGTVATKAIGADGSVWDGRPLSIIKAG